MTQQLSDSWANKPPGTAKSSKVLLTLVAWLRRLVSAYPHSSLGSVAVHRIRQYTFWAVTRTKEGRFFATLELPGLLLELLFDREMKVGESTDIIRVACKEDKKCDLRAGCAKFRFHCALLCILEMCDEMRLCN